MPIEEWIGSLRALEAALARPSESVQSKNDIANLVRYFAHMAEMLLGWEKNPVKRDENLAIIQGWKRDAAELRDLLSQGGAK